MNVKRIFIYACIVIIGSVISTTIDYIVGISFQDVGILAQITHKVTYMLWGAVILGMSE